MSSPYIVGNWKMNGLRASLSEARAIDRAAARYPKVTLALTPPATLISRMREVVQAVDVGGQDCHVSDSGAYTGDISAAMLKDAGAEFAIVGHSERRATYGESDETVRAKAQAALGAGLSVIVCVGETEAQRDAGQAESVVTAQVAASIPPGADVSPRVSLAYEPVWAIGTGRVPSVEDVATMHRAIRATLVETYGDSGKDIPILYGGSVKPENAAELLGADEVGGALIGGASLTAESYIGIVEAVSPAEAD
jgi:triosephosphate isomerase